MPLGGRPGDAGSGGPPCRCAPRREPDRNDEEHNRIPTSAGTGGPRRSIPRLSGTALGGGGKPRNRPAHGDPVPALTESVRGHGDQRSREEMRAPGGAAFDMPPRRRRGRTPGIIAGLRAERNRQAAPGPTVNAAAIRAGLESGSNRGTAFAGGPPVMAVAGPAPFRPVSSRRSGRRSIGWEG